MILGTNASLFRRLAALCGGKEGGTLAGVVNATGIEYKKESALPSSSEECSNETVGVVKWMGPGQLTIPSRGSCCVQCRGV